MDLSELIITLVRENECLYVKTNPDYKNVAKKNRIFQSISEKLRSESGIELSAENIKKRWSSLRDMFSRAQRNRRLQPSGSGYIPTKKWDLYDSMSFLTPHVAHRRSKSNFVKLASTRDEQESAELLENDQKDVILPVNSLVSQSHSGAQRRAEPYADDSSQANVLVTQSLRNTSAHTSEPFLSLVYAEDVSDNSSIENDHDYAVAEVCRTRTSSTILLTPSSIASSCHSSSSSSASTPAFQPVQTTSVVPELDNFAKRRRKSINDLEKRIKAAIELLAKVLNDMKTNVERKDPYFSAIEEGLKHVPAGDRTKCLIEIMQIIDKYQKI